MDANNHILKCLNELLIYFNKYDKKHVDDLSPLWIAEFQNTDYHALESACETYRSNSKNNRFPRPSVIKDLLNTGVQHKQKGAGNYWKNIARIILKEDCYEMNVRYGGGYDPCYLTSMKDFYRYLVNNGATPAIISEMNRERKGLYLCELRDEGYEGNDYTPEQKKKVLEATLKMLSIKTYEL